MNYHHDLKIYMPLKRYFSINQRAIGLAYGMLKKGMTIYEILHSEKYYEKVFEMSNKSYAYRNLMKQYIDATGADCKSSKEWSKLLNNPEKLIGHKVILNLHSPIGEEALKAANVLARKLIDNKKKVVITDGLKFSNDILNFEDKGNDISHMFEGDIVIFMATNAVAAKEYRQSVFNQLVESCYMKSIPLICTSNDKWEKDKWKVNKFPVVNLEFIDEKKNANEVLKSIFGDD